ncbi:MAG: hypothetical protein ACTSRK_02975 [Promethearchaeota archaeon]
MSSIPQPISKNAVKELGNTFTSYWKYFLYAQLGEFVVFGIWFSFHSPYTFRYLSTWALLNRFQWLDYITQGFLIIGWSVYLYFLILLLLPVFKKINEKALHHSQLKVAWGLILLGMLLQIFQSIFKLINYIQYYTFVHQEASAISPNFDEMIGLIYGSSAIMNISFYLNIIPASIAFLGILMMYLWGRTMVKHQSGNFSLQGCLKGFQIAVAGAALMVLRIVLNFHPTFPVFWAWLFGVLAIAFGFKKVADCLEIFS